MALLNWQEKYSVKIGKFDDAHKKIIDYINDLFELLKRKAGNDEIQRILDQMEEYTKNHFADEEAAMERLSYPKISEHKDKHRKLISELDALRAKKDIDSGLLNTQVLYFLKDWLMTHILDVDQKYSEHFNSHGLN